MASPGEEKRTEETEYESESEDSVFGLAMRRREASDDDDDNDKNDSEAEARKRLVWRNRRFGVGSGDESGGQGGYDDDYEVSIVDEHEELGDEELEVFKNEKERKHGEEEVTEEVKRRLEDEEKELVLDPKFGAFYMHDDRFRGRGRGYGRGRRRHTLDERFKEPKDQEKWMHDKFEEMNLRAWRTPEGYHPGQYKNKSSGRGYITTDWYKPHGNIDDQNYSSRIVKGRGPIKYKPIVRSSSVNLLTKSKQCKMAHGQTSNIDMERVLSTRNKQYLKPRGAICSAELARIFSTENKSGKFVDMTSNTNSAGAFSCISDVESDSLASEKHVFATNRSCSMQLFKSSSPYHFNCLTQKKDVQPEKQFGSMLASAVPNNNVPQFNALLHGEIAANPIGRDKLYAGKFVHPVSDNYLTNLPFQSFLSWPNYLIESTQMMGQRDLFFSSMLSHPLTPPSSQNNSVYPQAHSVTQHMPVESTIQPPLLVSAQQFSSCFESESQALAEALSPNSYESETCGTHTVSKVAASGEGIGTLQGMGRCSFPSAGIHGDENYNATGALISVTTNGNQCNGGHDGPAVNMPVTGYIPRLQSSVNPEMTWWPVFPAAARAIGASRCCPIATTDGDNHAHSTGQSSSLGASRFVYFQTQVKAYGTVLCNCKYIQDERLLVNRIINLVLIAGMFMPDEICSYTIYKCHIIHPYQYHVRGAFHFEK